MAGFASLTVNSFGVVQTAQAVTRSRMAIAFHGEVNIAAAVTLMTRTVWKLWISEVVVIAFVAFFSSIARFALAVHIV